MPDTLWSIAGDMSLRLDGVSHELKQAALAEGGDTLTRDLPGGIRIETRRRAFSEFGAVEWVNTYINTADSPSPLLSDVRDCDCLLPFAHDEKRKHTAAMPREEDAVMLYSPSGSTWSEMEFCDDPRFIRGECEAGMLFPGAKRRIETSGGRSSESKAPFFCLYKGDMGYIAAVGWSGQWFAVLERSSDALRLSCGVAGLDFRLNPGERLRAASVVIMPFRGRFIDGINKWRRFVRAHYSLIGQPGRPQHAPFCAGIWGGMSTQGVLDRLGVLRQFALPFEYVWMDAGWYGCGTQPSPDEFEGDWALHTGNWRVNRSYHPDGLKEVTEAIHAGGRKFILWFEPERVRPNAPVALQHPEYFLRLPDRTDLLLNLGCGEAFDYCLKTLSDKISELQIDILRIDFNIAPLPYWNAHDTDGRRGVTQLKYIAGLYRLWDALLARFPALLIDNCASGGRRIDIETLRRSVPLWRSDAMCPADFRAETAQNHALSFPLWLPYSGTGTGRVWPDTYRFRSCYAPALTTSYSFSERDSFGDDPAKLSWLKRMGEEYLRVRPWLEADFYPLTEPTAARDAWTVLQYHQPETDSGIVLVFRREASPFTEGVFELEALKPNTAYLFTDADSTESWEQRGNALKITISAKRASRLLFYVKMPG